MKLIKNIAPLFSGWFIFINQRVFKVLIYYLFNSKWIGNFWTKPIQLSIAFGAGYNEEYTLLFLLFLEHLIQVWLLLLYFLFDKNIILIIHGQYPDHIWA